ncbi:hypothetical protein G7Y89_g11582 [Cudoniella acicularis]|uniref:Alpha-carbonic anhydrase domain-containing protein n=1 Tax=Cudoniella acicularis TaxID=354080 RepID=A0A8H4VXW1_9HELO|nr:hypothetical protein G7Y89_g11582 [Cudoniella acicularis]
MFSTIVVLFTLSSAVSACPQHDFSIHNALGKRATEKKDWTYDASYNWGIVNTTPIPLLLTQGLSQKHIPTFTSSSLVAGSLYNWGYGPAFSVDTKSTPLTSGPSFTFDDEIVYLKGWHIHSPADHSVQGDRSKSELHLVHTDASGAERAVVAIRIDPGNADSPLFSQFEPTSNSSSTTSMIPNFDSTATIPAELDMAQALKEVNNFSEFWTLEDKATTVSSSKHYSDSDFGSERAEWGNVDLANCHDSVWFELHLMVMWWTLDEKCCRRRVAGEYKEGDPLLLTLTSTTSSIYNTSQ